MAQIHVLPDGDRWKLERDGGEVVDTFATQEEAIGAGRQVAEQDGAELTIHRQDGQIREKDSHGNDPRDVPG